MLPQINYTNGAAKIPFSKFNGIFHRIAAGNGDIWSDMNIVDDEYPVLVSRPAEHRIVDSFPGRYGALQIDTGENDLITIGATSIGYRNFTIAASFNALQTITPFNQFALLMPSKKWIRTDVAAKISSFSVPPPASVVTGKVYYNGTTCKTFDGTAWQDVGDIMGDIEKTVTKNVTIIDGTYGGVAAEANTISTFGANYHIENDFSVGDSVTLSGAAFPTERTLVIRETGPYKLVFYEHTFDDEKTSTPTSATISRKIPDLDFLFVHENRVWGYKDKTIYASKLGDFKNWNNFDGISTDSYAVDVPTFGDFTCGISFMGYPTFFKEDGVFKIYGSRPSNYEVKYNAVQGCVCGATLALANETLFYLSRLGVMQYTGGVPTPISDPLGDLITGSFAAVGFADGYKYYLRYEDDQYGRIFTYDQRRGMWHIERHGQYYIKYVFRYNNRLAAVSIDIPDGGSVRNTLWAVQSAGTPEEIDYEIQFADFDFDTFGSKYPVRLWFRYEADNDVDVTVVCDGDPRRGTALTLPATDKAVAYVPLSIQRCDRFALSMVGSGVLKLYAIQIETLVEQTSRKGG